MSLFTSTDAAVGGRSKLMSQTVLYVVVGVLQGVVFALLVPSLSNILDGNMDRAFSFLLAMCAVALVTALVLWFTTERGYHVSVEGLHDGLQRAIGHKVSRLPLGWFRSGRAGEVSHLVTTGAQDMMNIPSVFLQQLTVALTTPATVILVSYFIDWRLGVSLTVMVPLAILAYRWLQRSVENEQRAESISRAAVAAEVVEFAQAQAVLRATGQLEGDELRVDAALERNWRDGRRTFFKEMAPMATFSFIVEAGFVLAFVVAAYLVLGGTLTVGTFAAVLVLASRFVEPLTQVGAYGVALRKSRASLEKIHELLDTPELPEAEQPVTTAAADVVFENVTFGYGTEPVLRDFNLTFPARSVTALVGPSGGGKSTVLRLISRFWDVDSGAVRIGGVDVRQLPTTELMGMISTVFQDPYLFDDTITANVRLAKPEATVEQISAAIAAAELEEVAARPPEGLETRVGEGGHLLSGGERQRVAIARAFLKDAPILLLDEVTSALDGQTEAGVTTAMRRLSEQRTVIVIAHRLTTIAGADRIAVLDGGRVAELGTHAELLAKDGIYRRFWEDRERADQWKIERK